MCIHSKRNWQPRSYQFLLLFGKFTVDMLGTLSLILYKIPYHRLLLVHLFIYHLIARPTMGNYYILKFRKWFKYGLGASALYLCFTLRPVTVGSGRVEQNLRKFTFNVLIYITKKSDPKAALFAKTHSNVT